MHYGYSDGSGDYYIVIDTDRCNGCGLCINTCPQRALWLEPMFIDMEDKNVVAVKEEHRKKLKYTCACCKPESEVTPCMLTCKSKAIRTSWKPR